jgi:hypothetical protein
MSALALIVSCWHWYPEKYSCLGLCISLNYFGEILTQGIHIWFDRCLDVLNIMHEIETVPSAF